MEQNYKHLYGEDEPKTLLRDFLVGFVSGALVSAVKNSAKATDKNEKIKDGFKTAVQSGISASAISRSNRQMLCGYYVDGVLSLAIGGSAVYAIEKINESAKEKTTKEVTQ